MPNYKKDEDNIEEEPTFGLEDPQDWTPENEKGCDDKQDWTPEEICSFDSISAN